MRVFTGENDILHKDPHLLSIHNHFKTVEIKRRLRRKDKKRKMLRVNKRVLKTSALILHLKSVRVEKCQNQATFKII